MKSIVAAAALAATCGFALDSSAAPAPKGFHGQELLKHAKISLVQARKIALQAHPGAITDQELEREGGGSGLRYSFDIKDRSGVAEVGVDAKTGKVLENAKEGPHPD